MRDRLVILEVVARPVYWIILAASVWVLFTGHNEPGGGFIGGLVAVSATVLWAVAHGSRAAEAIGYVQASSMTSRSIARARPSPVRT